MKYYVMEAPEDKQKYELFGEIYTHGLMTLGNRILLIPEDKNIAGYREATDEEIVAGYDPWNEWGNEPEYTVTEVRQNIKFL